MSGITDMIILCNDYLAFFQTRGYLLPRPGFTLVARIYEGPPDSHMSEYGSAFESKLGGHDAAAALHLNN